MSRVLQSCYQFCRFLPVYWMLWWGSALWTDVTGALKVLGWLDAKWAFADNYKFLVKSLQLYPIPHWLPAIFLVSIIIWIAVATASFAIAVYYQIKQRPQWQEWTSYAFIVSLGLWMAFFIADQMIMNFDLEQNHMVQASFEMLCFIFFVMITEYHSE